MIAGEKIGMFLALAIAMLFLLSGAAAAEDMKAGPISVKDAWSRARRGLWLLSCVLAKIA